MLWWMQDWKTGPPAVCDCNLTVSNWFDPHVSLWGNPSAPLLYPIKLLDIRALTQAVMYLYARDCNATDGPQFWWRDMLIALADIPNTMVDYYGVRPPREVVGFCEPFWADFIQPKVFSMGKDLFWEALHVLRDVIVERGWLLPTPAPVLPNGRLATEISPRVSDEAVKWDIGM